jgi:hypothetical protein
MKSLVGGTLAVLLLSIGGCGRSPVAYGAANSIIVVAPEALWNSVRDTVGIALEPRIFTVREERTFTLTHVSPADPNWGTLRRWKQVLLVGEATDPWVEAALSRRTSLPESLPAFLEVGEVWARGQQVTLVLMPPGGGRTELLQLLPQLHAYLDGRFRAYARDRMYVSGADDALKRRLEQEAGFSLLLPKVYQRGSQDSVYLFRNDQQRQGELVRSVLVTWRTGVPADLSADFLLSWRDSLSLEFYPPGQQAERQRLEIRTLPAQGLEVQGIWSSLPGEWPGAGPFVDRIIVCPAQNRTYLLDAWLYAPGKDKYEYMLQLQTILDTFACGTT